MGWEPARVARAWVVLMELLGYREFVAQGGDWHAAVRSWAERAYPDNLIHYNKLDRGAHFAAWEQSRLFSEEMRASFGSLRK
jgi:hypothetical protein